MMAVLVATGRIGQRQERAGRRGHGGQSRWHRALVELLISDRKNLDGVKIHIWSLEATRLYIGLLKDDFRIFALSNEGQLSLIQH